MPDVPFRYSFLSEIVDQQYREERQWEAIVSYASAFVLLIACSGLFGLAALSAVRRTKEIGIRKALGASVLSIVALLSKDFLKLVSVAFILAAPLAYLAMRHWLREFAYRIELGPLAFVGADALVVMVALLAISYQSIKAALANPVESLKYE